MKTEVRQDVRQDKANAAIEIAFCGTAILLCVAAFVFLVSCVVISIREDMKPQELYLGRDGYFHSRPMKEVSK